MLLGKLNKAWSTHHVAVIIHNLTAKTCWSKACQLSQISSSFGMASATEHTAWNTAQWEYMTRTTEILRLSRWVNETFYGFTTLKGGDTCSGGISIHRYGKCCFMVISIVGHHWENLQPIQIFCLHRGTNKPLGISSHEVYVLRGQCLGGNNKVTFIFPVLVVNYDYHISFTYFFDCFFNCCKI